MYTKKTYIFFICFFIVSSQAFECTTSAFAAILPSNATVSYATYIHANGSFSEPSPEFPANDTNLPPLCALSINVISSSTSSFNFGLFLPQNWNSRFLTSGNGGFGGGINWNDMETSVLSGFVSMSTDTGHLSSSTDASWALNNSEAQTDWGYRAMHGSVALSKEITERYYGEKIQWSYFSACSTGGRQGFKEVQMFPEDFDGVLAGAPTWWQTHLNTWTIEVGLWNLPAEGENHISSGLFSVIAEEVLKQCDSQDGLIDGIISNPEGCEFVPQTLLCTPNSNRSSCLTSVQLETLHKIYNDWVETNNTFVFPHFYFGSEAQYVSKLAPTGQLSPLGTSWVQNFLQVFPTRSESWSDVFSYATVQLADKLDPGDVNADEFDISAFATKGGKLIHYHGMADGLIPPGASTYFYNQVLSTLVPRGIQVSDFYKLYLVPGMQHCLGSTVDAPWYFGGGGQAFDLGTTVHGVPGFEDSKHDVLLALMDWVEKGISPEEIIATKYVDDKIAQGVKRQRPLCVYPARARYIGTGNSDLAQNWDCKLPSEA